MHLIDLKNGFMGTSAIVGSSISLAVGMAFAFEFKKFKKYIYCIFRRGAREERYFQVN